MPDCFIEDGLYQIHERERKDREYWEKREANPEGTPVEESTEGLGDFFKKTFGGGKSYKGLFNLSRMQQESQVYTKAFLPNVYFLDRNSAVYIYKKLREEVTDYWDEITDAAIKSAAESLYHKELTTEIPNYKFNAPNPGRSNTSLSDKEWKFRVVLIRKRFEAISAYRKSVQQTISQKTKSHAAVMEGLKKIQDQRFVPYVKRILEYWLTTESRELKYHSDGVEFFYKEYETELKNLDATKESAEALHNEGLDEISPKGRTGNCLYTYVPKENTVETDGVYGPYRDTEANLVSRYGQRANATTKEGVLAWLEKSFPGRSKCISVLTEPIPDSAAPEVRKFRDESMLVVLPSYEELKRLGIAVAVYQPHLHSQGVDKVQVVDYSPVQWPKQDGYFTFSGIRYYFVVTKDGYVPPQYCKRIDFPSLEAFGMDIIVHETEAKVKASQEWSLFGPDVTDPDPLRSTTRSPVSRQTPSRSVSSRCIGPTISRSSSRPSACVSLTMVPSWSTSSSSQNFSSSWRRWTTP